MGKTYRSYDFDYGYEKKEKINQRNQRRIDRFVKTSKGIGELVDYIHGDITRISGVYDEEK